MNAPKPPGRNFTPNTRPVPGISWLNLRVIDSVHQPAGRSWPNRGRLPLSTVTCTDGWTTTSATNPGPSSSHATVQ